MRRAARRREVTPVPTTLAVHAGAHDHESPLVEVSIAADQINAAAPGASGAASHGPNDAAAVLLHDTDAPGGPGGIVVAQYDATDSVLRFVLPGRFVTGTTRHLDILPHAPGATTPPSHSHHIICSAQRLHMMKPTLAPCLVIPYSSCAGLC